MNNEQPISAPRRIACDPVTISTRLELLEFINQLNRESGVEVIGNVFWTVDYNNKSIIYKSNAYGEECIYEVYEGILP